MDHSSHGSQDMSSMDHSMNMYFHLSFGDALFFESWKPSTAGAVAGAAIGLALLAILERWLAAVRTVFEHRWAQRPNVHAHTEEEKQLNGDSSVSVSEPHAHHGRFKRTVPPLVWSRDLLRGGIYAVQALLSYLLMLAVMTFQGAYVISIVIGLSVGEILFGRVKYMDTLGVR